MRILNTAECTGHRKHLRVTLPTVPPQCQDRLAGAPGSVLRSKSAPALSRLPACVVRVCRVTRAQMVTLSNMRSEVTGS